MNVRRMAAVVLVAGAMACSERTEQAPPAGFRFGTSTDRMTDIVTTSVETQSRTGEVLTWSCRGDTLWVVLDFKRYLSPVDGYTYQVAHRFPPEPPATESWGAVGGRKMAGREGSWALRFTQAALRSSGTDLLLRVQGNDDSVSAEFDLSGLDEALKKLPCAAHQG